MLRRIIQWAVANRMLVGLGVVAIVVGGIVAIRSTPLEALPDLSDVQVIVQAEFAEQAPRIVEDQVTYPIAAEMLKVPGSRVVRGYRSSACPSSTCSSRTAPTCIGRAPGCWNI